MISRRSARLKAQELSILAQQSASPNHLDVVLDTSSSTTDLNTSDNLHPLNHGRGSASSVGLKATTRTGSYSGEVVLDDEVTKYLMTPVTSEDRRIWKGWCELESEPAFFNTMLRDLGVRGVKVQEVISLDEEMLNLLPKPLFGLIFLFQLREDESDTHEDFCPEHIWFANQITNNSCASIALMNIIMNVPDLELGPALDQLREFTMPLTSANRGFVVSSHETIRQVHNSFARKMDMLNADLVLSNEADVKRKRGKKRGYANTETPGFHFIAFVPIQGSLWKLDGLNRQPMDLGEFQGDWLHLARPIIEERMQRYEGDQLQFSLLSLCGSPLITIPAQLAVNIRMLCMVENQLDLRQPDWIQWIDTDESETLLREASEIYRVTSDQIEAAAVDQSVVDIINDHMTATAKLFEMRRDLVHAQVRLKSLLQDEIGASTRDEERAIGRRHDYTPIINRWLGMLVERGILKDLVMGG